MGEIEFWRAQRLSRSRLFLGTQLQLLSTLFGRIEDPVYILPTETFESRAKHLLSTIYFGLQVMDDCGAMAVDRLEEPLAVQVLTVLEMARCEWAATHLSAEDDIRRGHCEAAVVHLANRINKVADLCEKDLKYIGAKIIAEHEIKDVKLSNPEEASELSNTEADVVQALNESGNLTGSQLAQKAGYEENSHFRGVLSSLVKRRVIFNDRDGKGYYT